MSSLSAKRAQKEKELSMYNPVLTPQQISQMDDDVKKYRQNSQQYARRYLGTAAIGEISSLTPDNIKLINLKVSMPGGATAAVTGKTAPQVPEDFVVEGVIFGERDMLESLLAQYVMKLENSPLFAKIAVKKKEMNTFRKSEVLHFTLNARMG